MKVTKEYLQQVIKEEVDLMVQEGQIEEAFLDAFKGVAGKLGGDVSKTGKAAGTALAGAAKAGAEKVAGVAKAASSAVNDYASQVIKAGKTASTKADVAKTLATLSTDINAAIAALTALEERSVGLELSLGLMKPVASLKSAAGAVKNAQARAQAAAEEE